MNAGVAPSLTTDHEVHVPAQPGLLDELERRMVALGGGVRAKGGDLEGFPLVHTFTPGLYTRQITMPAGSVVTSKIHKTEHPFVISAGVVAVMIEGEGFVILRSPHQGITEPGTRRLLIMLEETVWTTFHATDLTDLEEIEIDILADYENQTLRLEVGQ